MFKVPTDKINWNRCKMHGGAYIEMGFSGREKNRRKFSEVLIPASSVEIP
jgi:hypothetical protein